MLLKAKKRRLPRVGTLCIYTSLSYSRGEREYHRILNPTVYTTPKTLDRQRSCLASGCRAPTLSYRIWYPGTPAHTKDWEQLTVTSGPIHRMRKKTAQTAEGTAPQFAGGHTSAQEPVYATTLDWCQQRHD